MLEITRRTFMLTSLAAMASGASALSRPAKQKKVRFGVVTDTHYADRDMVGVRYYRESLNKLEEFVNVMNSQEVDFVIHLGDFKDEDENKREQDTLKYLSELEKVFVGFNGPRFHCIGNHDVDSITKQQFLANVENSGIPNDRSYYSFDFDSTHFVVLDANYHKDGRDQFFKEGADWQDTNIPQGQLDWLEEDLTQTKNPAIVFCHHPLHEYRRDGHKFEANNYQEVQRIMEGSGKIQAVFQGHVHEEKFVEIDGIHYISQLAMVDYSGLENSSFSLVEVDEKEMAIHGYRRSGSKRL